MDRQALIRRLEEIAGPQGVISERNQLRTYECDGLANFRVVPSVVVLPETADQAQGAVRACHEAGVPFVARGSGTGLSGGALPVSDGVLIVLARMRRILEVDLDNQRAVVEPGVLNLQVTKEVAARRLLLRPRPLQPADLLHRRATWPRTRAAPTASSTASPPTTSPASRWCCPTASWSTWGAARRPTRRATTCSAPSWAPRAPSASPPR